MLASIVQRQAVERRTARSSASSSAPRDRRGRRRSVGAGRAATRELVAAEAGERVRRRRARGRRRCADLRRAASSPAWWPSVSLSSLKRSRSIMQQAGRGAPRSHARRRAVGVGARRFGRPVSSSVRAWRRLSARATFSRNAMAARTPMSPIAAVSRAIATGVRVPSVSSTSRASTTTNRTTGTRQGGPAAERRCRGRCVGRSAAATRQAAPMLNSDRRADRSSCPARCRRWNPARTAASPSAGQRHAAGDPPPDAAGMARRAARRRRSRAPGARCPRRGTRWSRLRPRRCRRHPGAA